jgi:hypothetical protein
LKQHWPCNGIMVQAVRVTASNYSITAMFAIASGQQHVSSSSIC